MSENTVPSFSHADVGVLVDMGFTKNQSERALLKTGFKGAQVAMDWIFAHIDDPDINDPVEMPPPSEGKVLNSPDAPVEEAAPVAKSLRCDICQKVMRPADTEFHAAKTGHDQFSESTEEVKPLTDEEKEEQLRLLEQKLSAKREERERREQAEQLERERSRRTEGRGLTKWREEVAQEDMLREAEARRREKEEEKAHLKRIRENYERDRREIELRQQQSNAPAQVSQTKPSLPEMPHVHSSKCRLQIRLPGGGAPMVAEFDANESLSAVACYVRTNRPDGNQAEDFALMTPFPRRVFTEEDMEKPLNILELCPSSVLQITKPVL